MPHCIVEYSVDLQEVTETDRLMKAVFLGASESMLFEPEDIKVRALGFDHYHSVGVKRSFIHVVVKILSGRSIKQKSVLSHLILAKLKEFDLTTISMTVEIVEIERCTYAKAVM